jgi:hypothetical protein
MARDGWYIILQAPADVDKTYPEDGQVLAWDGTVKLWEPIDLADILNPIYLRRDGTTPLTANWDAGDYDITALDFRVEGNIYLPTTTATTGILYSGAHSIGMGAAAKTLLHLYGTNNLFLGIDAGNLTNTGAGINIGIGTNALCKLASGRYNIALGYEALTSLVGNVSLDTGFDNIAIGYQALYSATGSMADIAIGSWALRASTGNANTAVGYSAGVSNVTGGSNALFGYGVLSTATSGSNNTAVGQNALAFNLAPENNTALGYCAGYSGTGNTNCVFLGYQAGYYETGNSKLFIDNVSRASEADARIKALIYGVFATSPADQDLTINADLYLGTGIVDTLATDLVLKANSLTTLTLQNEATVSTEIELVRFSHPAKNLDPFLTITAKSAKTGYYAGLILGGTGINQYIQFGGTLADYGTKPYIYYSAGFLNFDGAVNCAVRFYGRNAPVYMTTVLDPATVYDSCFRSGIVGTATQGMIVTFENNEDVFMEVDWQGKVALGSNLGDFGAQYIPVAGLDILRTTEQLRLLYSAAVYNSFTVTSAGHMNITNTGGYIGIHTAAPGYPMDFTGTLNVNGNIRMSGAAGSKTIYNYDGSLYLGTRANSDINFIAQDATVATLDQTDFNINVLVMSKNIYPATDNTYYLGKNSNSTPFAWKGVILKDTTDGFYYRIEVISGVVTATKLVA